MSLPFELIRALMVIEMSIFVLLILPLPLQWRKSLLLWISKVKWPSWMKKGVSVIFVLVIVLFADSLNRSIRMTYSYSSMDENIVQSSRLTKDTLFDPQWHAKMFYAQRNMYLTGFTLFLSIILNSFIRSLIDIVKVEEKMMVIQKQSAGHSKEYIKVLEQLKEKESKITSINSELEELRSKVKGTDAIIKQAKAQQEEYMRLSDRYNEMEKIVERRQNESKKEK